jgi:hypothetical protein
MSAATAAPPQWSMRGTVILACNCDFGCPCNFNGLPTYGKCEGNWNWHIADGKYGDESLSGLTFCVVANWPAAIHEGNGEAMIVIDERATPAQRDALMTLLSGQAGGPWKIISATLSSVNGPEFAQMDVSVDGYTSSVKAGRFIDLQMQPVRNPVTKVEVHPRAVLPEGFVFKDGQLGASAVFKVDGTVNFDHTGKYAAVAPFEYAGP